MPIVMGTFEMEQLAAKLAKMRFRRAQAHIRHLDKKCKLDIFRVAVGPEWHTRYTLPTKNLRVTLVERHEWYGEPTDRGLRKARFKYLEARVEPIPAHLLPKPAEDVFLLA